jgi:hypothetical protein
VKEIPSRNHFLLRFPRLSPQPPPNRKSFAPRTTSEWCHLGKIQSPQLQPAKPFPATATQPNSNDKMKPWCETSWCETPHPVPHTSFSTAANWNWREMLTNILATEAFTNDSALRPLLECGDSSPLFVGRTHVPGHKTSDELPNEGTNHQTRGSFPTAVVPSTCDNGRLFATSIEGCEQMQKVPAASLPFPSEGAHCLAHILLCDDVLCYAPAS